MWKNCEAYREATNRRYKRKRLSSEEYIYSGEKWKPLLIPERSNIPRRDQMTTADLQSVFREVIEQTLKDICANPSESDSKPCQFFSRQPTTKSAKQKSAAVAAGAGENVDTGASRRKKPVRLSPPDESVNPPKRRKLSGRKEEEEPAGEESGNEVQ